MSPIMGNEILPSGRTGVLVESAGTLGERAAIYGISRGRADAMGKRAAIVCLTRGKRSPKKFRGVNVVTRARGARPGADGGTLLGMEWSRRLSPMWKSIVLCA